MSLFKLKNLWSCSYPEEEFDEKHLNIGKIDGHPSIVLGSFKGYVRLYILQNSKQNFQMSLIYENNFDKPIVNVEFVQHPDENKKNTVGVLFYRKFAYISFKKNLETQNYQSNILQIDVDPAFAICPNPISVLTLNATIQSLNPNSVHEIKVSDPIYAFTSNEEKMYYSDGEELVLVQGNNEQWRITVGPIRNLHLWNQTVVVIGENALWQVENAIIQKTKVLDEDISYGTIIPKTDDYNIIVANFQNQFFIYNNNYSLLWAVKLDSVVLKVCIIQSSSFKGGLALLTEDGTLDVSFCGTEFPEAKIEPLNQNIDLKQVDIQINRYLAELNKRKQVQEEPHHVEQQKGSESIYVYAEAQNVELVEDLIEDSQKFYKVNGKFVRCTVKCEIKADRQVVTNVKVLLQLPSNIICQQKERNIGSIKGRQTINFQLYCSCEKFPFQTQGILLIRYKNPKKGSSFQSVNFNFPMKMQSQFVSWDAPENPTNKIVLKANGQLPSFLDLFPEYSSKGEGKKSLTIELANSIQCSVGYNKGNTKVKFESEFFSGLCFLTISYIEKLKDYNKRKNKQVQLNVDIPLQQFFTIMKDHHQYRNTIKQRFEELHKNSEQFLAMQKRLLLKMKEKMSTANNLDKVLDYIYGRLLQATDNYERACQQMQIINHNLEISVKFITQLLFVKTQASNKCKKIVNGIIGYEKENTEYGWEQKIMCNSSYFLNKRFNYTNDKFTFDQVYKIVIWVISKVNSGQWN